MHLLAILCPRPSHLCSPTSLELSSAKNIKISSVRLGGIKLEVAVGYPGGSKLVSEAACLFHQEQTNQLCDSEPHLQNRVKNNPHCPPGGSLAHVQLPLVGARMKKC